MRRDIHYVVDILCDHRRAYAALIPRRYFFVVWQRFPSARLSPRSYDLWENFKGAFKANTYMLCSGYSCIVEVTAKLGRWARFQVQKRYNIGLKGKHKFGQGRPFGGPLAFPACRALVANKIRYLASAPFVHVFWCTDMRFTAAVPKVMLQPRFNIEIRICYRHPIRKNRLI